MKRIAIFASGSGTNAENIVNYFSANSSVEVSIILSNKKNAFVHERAKKLGIESRSFTRETFFKTDEVLDVLKELNVDFIVLAGFLWLVPNNLLESFPKRIVNIHPALLPKYGGKGMFGDNVHKAVIGAGDLESGITIHYVQENYDEGQVIFQASCSVEPTDDYVSLADKIHALEYEHFPKVIEELL